MRVGRASSSRPFTAIIAGFASRTGTRLSSRDPIPQHLWNSPHTQIRAEARDAHDCQHRVLSLQNVPLDSNVSRFYRVGVMFNGHCGTAPRFS